MNAAYEVPAEFRVLLALLPLLVLAVLFSSAVTAIAWCFIWKRAGYSWALGLLMLLPVANIVAFFVLAFSRWPVQRRLDRLEGRPGGVPARGEASARPC